MLKVIDISSNNEIVDWQKVKEQFDGVIMKATEGKTYVDPTLNESVQACIKYKIPFGFYHFARRNNPLDEYQNFINAIRPYIDEALRKLPLFLDYEIAEGADPPCNYPTDFDFIKVFMGINPCLLFYSSHNIADKTGIPINKIWVAEPNTTPVTLKGYSGIQYNWHGHYEGINGDVDVNLFEDFSLSPTLSAIQEITKGGVNMIPIKRGEGSSRVRLLQGILSVLIRPIKIDGDFEGETEQAVKDYQTALHLTVDGEAGIKTMTTLFSDLKGNWFKFDE